MASTAHHRERARGQLRLHQAGAEEEDGDPPGELVGQHLAVTTDGSLARRIRGALAAGQIRRSAAGDHDPAAAALEHARDHGPAGQVNAEHVDLIDLPPLGRVDLPRRPLRMTLADSRVGDQQIHVARLGDHPLDRGAIGDVDLHPRAVDLARDRFDLRAAARGNDHVPAIARQRPSDTRSDPTSATGHKRSHRTPPSFSPRRPPGAARCGRRGCPRRSAPHARRGRAGSRGRARRHAGRPPR